MLCHQSTIPVLDYINITNLHRNFQIQLILMSLSRDLDHDGPGQFGRRRARRLLRGVSYMKARLSPHGCLIPARGAPRVNFRHRNTTVREEAIRSWLVTAPRIFLASAYAGHATAAPHGVRRRLQTSDREYSSPVVSRNRKPLTTPDDTSRT